MAHGVKGQHHGMKAPHW